MCYFKFQHRFRTRNNREASTVKVHLICLYLEWCRSGVVSTTFMKFLCFKRYHKLDQDLLYCI